MLGIAQNSFIMLMLLAQVSAIFFLGACHGQSTTGFVGAKGQIVIFHHQVTRIIIAWFRNQRPKKEDFHVETTKLHVALFNFLMNDQNINSCKLII